MVPRLIVLACVLVPVFVLGWLGIQEYVVFTEARDALAVARSTDSAVDAVFDPILRAVDRTFLAAMIVAGIMTVLGGWALVRRYRSKRGFVWLFALWVCCAIASYWYGLGLPSPF